MFFRKRYKSGKIRIVSDFELTQKQVEKIVGIINNVDTNEFYSPCYEISRNVFHQMIVEKPSIAEVKTKPTRFGGFKITITDY